MEPAARLTITRLGAHGDGLARHDDAHVSIPFTLPGEMVRAGLARGNHGLTGRLLEIETPSPQRRAAPCAHFTACGGCVMQHADDILYRDWKRGKVRHLLEKAGISHPCDDLFVTPPYSRRRAVFTATRKDTGVALGFNRRGSHELIDLQQCVVLRPAITALLPSLRMLLAQILKLNAHLDIHVTELGNVLSVAFMGSELDDAQERAATEWALQQGVGSLWAQNAKTGSRILLQQSPLIASYGDALVALPPGPFLQASNEAESAMLEFMRPFMKGVTHYADLFCGSGLFALSFSTKNTHVTAADADGRALDALRAASRNRPQMKVETRNLFRDPYLASSFKAMQAIILDPPRAGAAAQIQEIAKSSAPLVIYVSCNPGSFAADAAKLQAGGYALKALKLFDQFLWSEHVELVSVFTRPAPLPRHSRP